MDLTKNLATRSKRFIAYIIDIIPIVLVVFVVFYLFFGFDETLKQYLTNTESLDLRAAFLKQRNHIRETSFFIWLIYCAIMESSNKQGTFGKYIMGIKVVDENGDRLTLQRSIKRSSSKILSYVVMLLGFIWILFDKKRQGWHDKLNKTFVVTKDYTPKYINRELLDSLSKTSEMLDEDTYWSIIDKSLKSTSSQDEQEKFLIQEIEKLPPNEMIGFRLRTDKLLYDTYTPEMWCAGYIMNGGCSDDGFEYFRNWIISRGKEVYYSAKQNPDSLVNEIDTDLEMYDFESFWYVALEAFKNTTGGDLYEYIDEENFKTSEGNYPDIKFNWQEENPETMKAICPKLFEKLG